VGQFVYPHKQKGGASPKVSLLPNSLAAGWFTPTKVGGDTRASLDSLETLTDSQQVFNITTVVNWEISANKEGGTIKAGVCSGIKFEVELRDIRRWQNVGHGLWLSPARWLWKSLTYLR